MKIVVAITMGFLASVLIFFALLFVFGDFIFDYPKLSALIAFLGSLAGWVGFSFLMLRNARTVSKVFSRGFLIGAAEWLAIIPLGMIWGARTMDGPLGVGTAALMTTGVAVPMAAVCFLGFGISYFIGREMNAEPLVKCPECAETIKAAARRCRFLWC